MTTIQTPIFDILFVIHEGRKVFLFAAEDRIQCTPAAVVEGLSRKAMAKPALADALRKMCREEDEPFTPEKPFVEIKTLSDNHSFDATYTYQFQRKLDHLERMENGKTKYFSSLHMAEDSEYIPW